MNKHVRLRPALLLLRQKRRWRGWGDAAATRIEP